MTKTTALGNFGRLYLAYCWRIQSGNALLLLFVVPAELTVVVVVVVVVECVKRMNNVMIASSIDVKAIVYNRNFIFITTIARNIFLCVPTHAIVLFEVCQKK